MKIYLDNNLGVSNVEQEELTQDTYGYNILKVYIPNAVLTPYDTFTCYYGALLQNGRKVGWFAMEARTSSDADYKANYTLYKATLEQCVVSVDGKVYIGCQVLLGNSGNATLIKKNTAVVQFNVRKSVAINNDILVLDPDQTTTDVLESYKNLLENALTTYATKAEVASGYAEIDGGNVDTFKANDFILDGISLKDSLFDYTENVDITDTLTLTSHYLDKANGNANPDVNSRCTNYIYLSTYTGFLISGHSQYATTLICTYDENKTFLRSYGDGTSAGLTFTDYQFIPQSDEKYVRFSTYQYTQYPLKVVSFGELAPITDKKQDNYLFNKKYVACGDSFTKGDVISSDKVYPYLIAQRNNMRFVNMAHNGSYCHYGENGFTNPNNSYYYQNIPLDADIITIAYGLNETSTTIGTKDSADNTTIWGAYNEVLGWITTNIPNAKIGIISNDAWMTYDLRNALQEIASYWGVEFLDLKEYGKPFMISGKYSQDGDTNPSVVSQRTTQYCVSSQNGHPNELGHKVRSYIVENFLRGAYGVDNSYTRKETDTKLDLKADKTDTYTKQEIDAEGMRIYTYIDRVDTSLNTRASHLEDRTLVLERDFENLKSVQNVVDVVATKSDLNSYDPTYLGIDDKVQVIADETHDGASTIYNWDGTEWQYVGAFGGNFYTKAETYNKTQIDSALSDKADKSNTYTRAVIDSMILTLSTDKADKINTYTKTEIDGKLEEIGPMFEIVENELEKKADKTEVSRLENEIADKSKVVANPTLVGDEPDLEGAEIDGIKYKVGGGGKLYQHCLFMRANVDPIYSVKLVLYRSTATPLVAMDLAVINHYYNATGTSRIGDYLIYGLSIENNLTFNFGYKTIVDGAFRDNSTILSSSNFTLFIDTVTEV